MENQILIGIIAVSAAVFVIVTVFYYPDVIKKILFRLGLGMAGIAGANYCLSLIGAGIYVGLNPLSILVLLVLGGPGVVLLYGIEAYGKFFI